MCVHVFSLRFGIQWIVLFLMCMPILAQAQCGPAGFRKIYGYTGSPLKGHSLLADDAGMTLASVVNNGPNGGKDWVVIRTDPSGNAEWASAYGTALNEDGTNLIVASLADGGFVLAGYRQAGNQNRDLVFSRHDAEGNVLWGKQITGHAQDDTPRDVLEMPNGDIWIVGTSNSFSFGSSDAFILALNAAGDVLWADHFGANLNDHFYGIEQRSDGNILIAGNSQSFVGGAHHPWVLLFDQTGNLLIQRLIHGPGTETGFSAAIDESDRVYICGYSTAGASTWNAYLAGFDENLNYLWTRLAATNGTDSSSEILYKDGLLYTTTRIASSPLAGDSDILLSCFDPSGAGIWQQFISGPGVDEVQAVTGNLVSFGDRLFVAGSAQNYFPTDATLLSVSNLCGDDGCTVSQEFEFLPYTHSVMTPELQRATWGTFSDWITTRLDIEVEEMEICMPICELEAGFGVVLPQCAGDSLILFNESISNQEMDASWYADNILIGEGDTLHFLPEGEGLLELNLQVVTADGVCQESMIQLVEIEFSDGPSWSYSTAEVLCGNEVLSGETEPGFQWMLNGLPLEEAWELSQTGDYLFQALDSGQCVFEFDLELLVVDAPPSFPDSSLTSCGQVPLPELDANYDWSVNGSPMDEGWTFPGSGTYTFTASASSCVFTSTSEVSLITIEAPEWEGLYVLCENEELVLFPPDEGILTLNNAAVYSDSIVLVESGEYNWSYVFMGCEAMGSFNLETEDAPLLNALDESVCVQDIGNFDPQLQLCAECTVESTTVTELGDALILSVQYTHPCGSFDQEFQFPLVDCYSCEERNVSVPNAFTPNNDGVNEVFLPVFECEPEQYDLRIFNRWGQEVFASTDPLKAWPGDVSEGDYYVQNEVYVWYLKWSFSVQPGSTLERKGFVAVLR